MTEGQAKAKSRGINLHSETDRARAWVNKFQGQPWSLVCTLGFTETALIPGISAAGNTPEARRWTAIADSEFLHCGITPHPATHPLPPLDAGLSPVLITRALIELEQAPIHIFNAGLLQSTAHTGLDLGGQPASCVSTGRAMPLSQVKHLLQAGLSWGERLGQQVSASGPIHASTPAPSKNAYLVLGECVVGGTTTALGVLMGLGIEAAGRVNSSHPCCNHGQKQRLVNQGLRASGLNLSQPDPLAVVAAVGDPMQIFVAGIAIAASPHCGILLAGGTQMLAVYALAAALVKYQQLPQIINSPRINSPVIDSPIIDLWNPDNIAVGTTRWVALDPSGDTPGLAQAIGQHFQPAPMLLSTALDFSNSSHPALRAYEEGFVKEGVAAGGSAIATSLSRGLSSEALVGEVDRFCDRYNRWRRSLEQLP